jgi:ketosteroid isomerase-like protein
VTGCVLALAACERPGGDPAADIAAMLARSTADWNRGDLAGFMDDYLQDSTLSYVSGRGVLYGWQPLYDRYQRGFFAPGAPRDSLRFTDLAVRSLDDDLAFATARFQLMRGDSVVSSGPFTLILRKRGARWLIVHDHTSSDPKP